MIPVMIMGTLVGGKRYSVIEYVCSGLIAGGISLFAAQVNLMACCLPLLCTGSGKLSRELMALWEYCKSDMLLVSDYQAACTELCRAQAKWLGSWLRPMRHWVMDCASSI